MKKQVFAFLALTAIAGCSTTASDAPLEQSGTETGVITIVNNYTKPIRGLDLRRCEVEYVQPDILGGNTIEVGQSRDFPVSVGCYTGIAHVGTFTATALHYSFGHYNVTAGETVIAVLKPR